MLSILGKRKKNHIFVASGISGILYDKRSSKNLHLKISFLLQGKLTSSPADIYTWKLLTEAILNDNINYNIYKTSFHEALNCSHGIFFSVWARDRDGIINSILEIQACDSVQTLDVLLKVIRRLPCNERART